MTNSKNNVIGKIKYLLGKEDYGDMYLLPSQEKINKPKDLSKVIFFFTLLAQGGCTKRTELSDIYFNLFSTRRIHRMVRVE